MNTETYWRAGFTVAGAPPVTVDEYVRRKDDAELLALGAAKDMAGHSELLGIEITVTAWTQRWTTTRVVKVDDQVEVDQVHVRRADPDTARARYESTVPLPPAGKVP